MATNSLSCYFNWLFEYTQEKIKWDSRLQQIAPTQGQEFSALSPYYLLFLPVTDPQLLAQQQQLLSEYASLRSSQKEELSNTATQFWHDQTLHILAINTHQKDYHTNRTLGLTLLESFNTIESLPEPFRTIETQKEAFFDLLESYRSVFSLQFDRHALRGCSIEAFEEVFFSISSQMLKADTERARTVLQANIIPAYLALPFWDSGHPFQTLLRRIHFSNNPPSSSSHQCCVLVQQQLHQQAQKLGISLVSLPTEPAQISPVADLLKPLSLSQWVSQRVQSSDSPRRNDLKHAQSWILQGNLLGFLKGLEWNGSNATTLQEHLADLDALGQTHAILNKDHRDLCQREAGTQNFQAWIASAQAKMNQFLRSQTAQEHLQPSNMSAQAWWFSPDPRLARLRIRPEDDLLGRDYLIQQIRNKHAPHFTHAGLQSLMNLWIQETNPAHFSANNPPIARLDNERHRTCFTLDMGILTRNILMTPGVNSVDQWSSCFSELHEYLCDPRDARSPPKEYYNRFFCANPDPSVDCHERLGWINSPEGLSYWKELLNYYAQEYALIVPQLDPKIAKPQRTAQFAMIALDLALAHSTWFIAASTQFDPVYLQWIEDPQYSTLSQRWKAHGLLLMQNHPSHDVYPNQRLYNLLHERQGYPSLLTMQKIFLQPYIPNFDPIDPIRDQQELFLDATTALFERINLVALPHNKSNNTATRAPKRL